MWALRTYPSDATDDWADFLRSLPGRPTSVISDAPQPNRNGLKAVREDGVRYSDGQALGSLLAQAFTSPQAWAASYA